MSVEYGDALSRSPVDTAPVVRRTEMTVTKAQSVHASEKDLRGLTCRKNRVILKILTIVCLGIAAWQL